MSDTELTSEENRLAQRLLSARIAKGISQEVVAKELQIPRASVSAIETGKRRVGSIELKRLARLYRVSISELLEDTEEEEVLNDETTREARTFLRAYGTLDEDGRRFIKQAFRVLQRVNALDKNTGNSEEELH